MAEWMTGNNCNAIKSRKTSEMQVAKGKSSQLLDGSQVVDFSKSF